MDQFSNGMPQVNSAALLAELGLTQVIPPGASDPQTANVDKYSRLSRRQMLDTFASKFTSRFAHYFITDADFLLDLQIPSTNVDKYMETKTDRVRAKITSGHYSVWTSPSPDLIYAGQIITQELMSSTFFKALVAAGDEAFFKAYCPRIAQYYSKFKAMNIEVAQYMLQIYPVLQSHVSSLYLFGNSVELGLFAQSIDSLAEKNEPLKARFAADQDAVINALIQRWRGNSAEGFRIISDSIYKLCKLYSEHTDTYKPENYLKAVFEGYSKPLPQSLQTSIDNFIETFSMLSPNDFFFQFEDEIWPQLSALSLERAKRVIQAPENIEKELVKVVSNPDFVPFDSDHADFKEDFWGIEGEPPMQLPKFF